MKRGDPLSQRELDIARLLAEGKSRIAIGLALELSPSTVGTHLHRMKKKLGTANSVALAARVGAVGVENLKVKAPGSLTPERLATLRARLHEPDDDDNR